MKQVAPRKASSIRKGTWVIRAGKSGEADDLFLEKDVIVLSDSGLGDLRKLQASREAFYQAYRTIRPEETRISATAIGGKFYRFVHEIQIGDLVLYPSLKDRHVYVGKITGEYIYSPKTELFFPHQRSVIWLFTIPKANLSESARRELGAARTFFRFKTHDEEIRVLLGRKRNLSSEGVKRARPS